MNDTIMALEKELKTVTEKLAKARQSAPAESVDDYSFTRSTGETVTLAGLFDSRDQLFVIHNMGKGCVYCTMWADGFASMWPHIQSRAAFVLSSPDDPKTQKAFAASRGWRYPMISTAGTSFAEDMGFKTEKGLWPGVSAFVKGPYGQVQRTGRAIFGPGDEFCSAWHFFDLLPGGVGDWAPKYDYQQP